MHIISLTRKTGGSGIPDTFVVGATPMVKEEPIENSPIVKEIKFFETSPVYVRICKGPFYVVEFVKSTVRRIIPASAVLDIAVESAKEPADKIQDDIILGE